MAFTVKEPKNLIATRIKLPEETVQLRDELIAYAKQDPRLKHYDIDSESCIALHKLYEHDLKGMKARIAKLDGTTGDSSAPSLETQTSFDTHNA